MPMNLALGQDIASAFGFELFTPDHAGQGITKVEFTLERDQLVSVRVTGHVPAEATGGLIEKIKTYTMVEQG